MNVTGSNAQNKDTSSSSQSPPLLSVGAGGNTITVTKEIHRYLLETYFTSIHPLYPFLDEALPFLSPDNFVLVCDPGIPPCQRFILEMVYSIACHAIVPVPPPMYFVLASERHAIALQYIDHATSLPTLMTLQAITLLAIHSLFDPLKGNFNQLIGFVARLVLDIERHDSNVSAQQPQNLMSATSTEDQEDSPPIKNIYISIYSLENQFCTILDRPNFLPEPVSSQHLTPPLVMSLGIPLLTHLIYRSVP